MGFHNPTWLKQEILACLLELSINLGFQLFRTNLVELMATFVSVSVITGSHSVI